MAKHAKPASAPPARKPARKSARTATRGDARSLAVALARNLTDDRCQDVLVLDARGKSQVTDFIVIGSGTSDRQMRSALDHAVDLAAETGHKAYRVSVDDDTHWLVADFVDVIVHLFEPNPRAHYDLEMLWGDAPKVRWKRAAPRADAAQDSDET